MWQDNGSILEGAFLPASKTLKVSEDLMQIHQMQILLF